MSSRNLGMGRGFPIGSWNMEGCMCASGLNDASCNRLDAAGTTGCLGKYCRTAVGSLSFARLNVTWCAESQDCGPWAQAAVAGRFDATLLRFARRMRCLCGISSKLQMVWDLEGVEKKRRVGGNPKSRVRYGLRCGRGHVYSSYGGAGDGIDPLRMIELSSCTTNVIQAGANSARVYHRLGVLGTPQRRGWCAVWS